MSAVEAMAREIERLRKRIDQLKEELEWERRSRLGPEQHRGVEPLVIPPDEACIDPDGHRMQEFHSPFHLYPVAAMCGTCGRHGRVKRDTTPQDA